MHRVKPGLAVGGWVAQGAVRPHVEAGGAEQRPGRAGCWRSGWADQGGACPLTWGALIFCEKLCGALEWLFAGKGHNRMPI